MEQKTNIRSEILQQFLESAANAAEKGMSQFFTPPEFGRWCAQALPRCRPTIVDLNCGNGQLLQACALNDGGLTTLLGSDIDPTRSADGVHLRRITCDATKLHGWLAEINFKADLFALNPPWRLHWHKERLQDLAESDCDAVRDAFAEHEPGAPRDTIDSTVATLMMALDRCTRAGEGLLIANNNTLDRLIFNPDAPFKILSKHIWARVIVPGNPMTGIDKAKWHDKPDASGAVTEFKTGVIYFAANHTVGTTHYEISAAQLATFLSQPNPVDRVLRMGSEVRQAYFAHEDTVELWEAAREQVKEMEGGASIPTSRYNLFLVGDRIVTQLSLFASKSTKTNKAEAERMFKLNGKTPMEMVLQRNQRDDLLHVLDHSAWKIEPALREAVAEAVRQYHAARAPLYPLPEIQRLGYLDEQDAIECKRDLSLQRHVVLYHLESEAGEHIIYTPDKKVHCDFDDIKEAKKELKRVNDELVTRHPSLVTCCRAGQKYSIRTQTVQVTRTTYKPNSFTGETEELEFTGQELAIFIGNKLRPPSSSSSSSKSEDDDFEEFCFMDGKLRDGKTKIAEARQQKSSRRAQRYQREPDAIPIDFALQQLIEHFIIPEVPDVATNNPEVYRDNLKRLEEIEQLCAL